MSAVETKDRSGFATVQAQRARLAELIERHATVVGGLNLAHVAENIDELRRRVAADTFKVLVLGEFKRGKSTIINALLGEKVLPAYAWPTTATINEVKWGEERRAVLYPRADNGGPPPAPREIPIDQLEEHVVIKDETETTVNPYERVEVFWPLKLCENGVEVIDSPGLNEHASREKVTLDYLGSVDAILFVMLCIPLGSKQEFQLIENTLIPAGHDNLFFLCNRINDVAPEDREGLIERSSRRLEEYTVRGRDGIFFLNARGALEGRLEGDVGKLAESGLPEVERELERFLVRERGKVKVRTPARVLQRSVQEIMGRDIPEREELLAHSLEELEQRVRDAQEPLRQVEAERNLVVERMSAHIRATRDEVVRRGRSFYTEIPDQFEALLEDFEPETNIGLIPRREKLEAYSKEIGEHLHERIDDVFAAWRKRELDPYLAERQDELAAQLEHDAAGFLTQLDEIRVDLRAGAEPSESATEQASAGERLLAAAGGFLLAGPGAAVAGAQTGVAGMAKALLPQVGVALVGAFFLYSHPIGWLALIMGSSAIQAMVGKEAVAKKVKAKMIATLGDDLRVSASDHAAKMGGAVENVLLGLRDTAAKGMDAEIERTREEMNTVLEAKREGEATVARERESLRSMRRELHQIDVEVGDLIDELAVA